MTNVYNSVPLFTSIPTSLREKVKQEEGKKRKRGEEGGGGGREGGGGGGRGWMIRAEEGGRLFMASYS